MSRINQCNQHINIEQGDHTSNAFYFSYTVDQLVGHTCYSLAVRQSPESKIVKPLVFVAKNLF